MKRILFAAWLLATAAPALAQGPDARARAAEWYEKDKALCAEERSAERRMQCLRDARAVYDKAIAGAAPAAPAAAPATAPVAAPTAPAPATPVAASAPCAHCGTVLAVRELQAQGEASGLGAVAGGVAGALLGSRLGKGDGRKVMTVAGAAGGAYAGHQVEKNMKKSAGWDVVVRMDDGGERTIRVTQAPALAPGDRVRIEGDAVLRR